MHRGDNFVVEVLKPRPYYEVVINQLGGLRYATF